MMPQGTSICRHRPKHNDNQNKMLISHQLRDAITYMCLILAGWVVSSNPGTSSMIPPGWDGTMLGISIEGITRSGVDDMLTGPPTRGYSGDQTREE